MTERNCGDVTSLCRLRRLRAGGRRVSARQLVATAGGMRLHRSGSTQRSEPKRRCPGGRSSTWAGRRLSGKQLVVDAWWRRPMVRVEPASSVVSRRCRGCGSPLPSKSRGRPRIDLLVETDFRFSAVGDLGKQPSIVTTSRRTEE
jgi:hypothetical protein